MIGRTVSHYKIMEELGRGGMGVVYKAQDTKLKRTVALKFLPPEMTRNKEAKNRFIQEAQAASAMDHPNICTIHEIGETDDGQIFMAMACYEGQTLKERLENIPLYPPSKGDLVRIPPSRGDTTFPPSGGIKGGVPFPSPLPIPEALDIAIQIAHGLSKAHEHGIVHRDIKPANIFITCDSVVKIIDFGLTKLAGQTKLTKAGTTLGTTAYMSPEQAKGESIDHRTDIWSLGVILYEMLTGQMPFKGEYDQAVLYSILNELPQPMSTLRPDVPQELEDILNRCLCKNPSDRYPGMVELATDLECLEKAYDSKSIVVRPKYRTRRFGMKIARTALYGIVLAGGIAAVILYFVFAPGKRQPTSTIKRLVVLPFENVGPAENEYFTDGMTEELTTRLATLSGLGVISRTSAFHYAKTNKTIEQIGKELNVEYALEGAVRWARARDGSSRVRITPNLTQISDKTTLWAETYDRVMDDIFQIQSEISQKVVEKLGITLLEPERKTVDLPPTKNLEAYQAYLRARYYEGRPHFSVENWMRVVEGYQQAVKLDPGFALAFAELARAHARFYTFWYDHSTNRLDMARQAAAKAVALAPELPGVHLALGYYHLYAFRDPKKALEEFTIAEKGLMHSAEIYQARAAVSELQGRWEDALENDKKAFELSPRDASVVSDLVFFYWTLRRYKEAFETSNLDIELSPDDAWPYLFKAFNLWSWKGAFHETRSILKSVPANHAWEPWAWFWQDMFERRYREAIERLSSTPGDWIRTKCWAMPKSLLTAFANKLLGEQEQSLRAYESAKYQLEAEVKQSPDDPRFHSSLGIAYASLGRKKEAIREGKKAVELLTVSRDAFYGLPYVEDLAFIYTLVGETDAALDRLDYLLSTPSWISVCWLQIDPQWDALRNQPGFIKLLKKHSYARE